MKELSIEEKAKRYDEAIEKAKIWHIDCQIDFKKSLELLFPELKESDDERIRKELLEHCKNQAKPYIQTGNKCPQIQSWIDWLEKQGESNMGISEATKKELENNLNNALEKETPESWNEFLDENKIKPKFKVGDKIQYLKGCGIPFLIEKIENGEYIFANNMGHTYIESGNKWHLVEQTPAWSEEDERMFSGLISIVEDWYNNMSEKEKEYYGDCGYINWLKTIKHQNILYRELKKLIDE
jgi:hypothetical protein